MSIEVIFFDLDDTLYDGSTGLWQAIRQRMEQYMVERLGLQLEMVSELRRSYLETYGTTLRGLQANYHVDTDEYLAYVHDFQLDLFLEPAPEMRQMLLSLPQRRWIFTNSDQNHAARVLRELELEGCFEGIIDIRALQFACKPEPAAYQVALAIAGQVDPKRCLILDDSIANLQTARQFGMTTVLVNREGASHPAADYTVRHVLELRQALPELWDGARGVGNEH